MSISITFDTKRFESELGRLAGSLNGIIADAVSDIGDNTRYNVADETPRDTGNLASKWEIEKEKDSFRVFLNGSEHEENILKWLEFGTGLYGPKKQMIRPKHAKFMHWVDKLTGRHIFARQTRGIRPFAMVWRTRTNLEYRAQDDFNKYIENWLAK